MIVAVFVLFSLFRGLTHKRKSSSAAKSPTPSAAVVQVSGTGPLDRLQHHKNNGSVEGTNLNSSIEDLCVSLCQSESIYSSATSKIYDKRRQDSSSICSDIFNTDEGGGGGRSSVSEETRFTARKSLTRIRRCTSRTSLSRRRRTTGR